MRIGFPKKIPPPIDQSCVGYWKLDEQTGILKDYSGNGNNGTSYSTNLNDLSGNGNHGTITGATRVAGKLGQALSFNGSTTYVNCGNSASLSTLNGIWSCEFWINPNNVHNRQTIIGHEDQSGVFQIEIGDAPNPPNSQACVNIIIPGSSRAMTQSNTVIVSTWNHFIVTLNGGSGGDCHIYKNGVDLTLGIDSGVGATNPTNITTLGRRDASRQYFNGLMDDVRIYNRVLSQTEVTVHYNGGVGLISDPSTEIGLVGYWRMGITDGMTIPGKFGNALKFDGIDDYVDCGTGASLNITSIFTAEAWIKPSLQVDSGIVSRDDGVNRSWFISYADSGGRIRFGVFKTNVFSPVFGLTNLILNRWYHIACVNDGTNLKIYLDGILDNSAMNGGTFDSDNANTQIGKYAGSIYFNGTIDDIRIYNRILSTQEIKRHYMSGR